MDDPLLCTTKHTSLTGLHFMKVESQSKVISGADPACSKLVSLFSVPTAKVVVLVVQGLVGCTWTPGLLAL